MRDGLLALEVLPRPFQLALFSFKRPASRHHLQAWPHGTDNESFEPQRQLQLYCRGIVKEYGRDAADARAVQISATVGKPYTWIESTAFPFHPVLHLRIM